VEYNLTVESKQNVEAERKSVESKFQNGEMPLRKKSHFSLYQKRSVMPKYAKKCIYGRDSAPDPAGRSHDTLADPIVSWGGGTLGAFG